MGSVDPRGLATPGRRGPGVEPSWLASARRAVCIISLQVEQATTGGLRPPDGAGASGQHPHTAPRVGGQRPRFAKIPTGTQGGTTSRGQAHEGFRNLPTPFRPRFLIGVVLAKLLAPDLLFPCQEIVTACTMHSDGGVRPQPLRCADTSLTSPWEWRSLWPEDPEATYPLYLAEALGPHV